MDNAATSLPPLSPRDEAVVLQLANELHGIAPLPIASHGECLNIARALLDVGCASLVALLELPEQPINSVDDLKSYLHNLRYPLGKLQLCRISQWIQQQRQASASIPDVGSKRAHPESPLLARAGTTHITAAQTQTDTDAHTALSAPPAHALSSVPSDVEAAGLFMEIV
jgi:hypothetical protein